MRFIYRITAVIAFSFTCLFSHAAIPPQQMVIELPKVKPIAQPKSNIELAKIIPTNLQPGQTEEQIGMRMVDHSVNNFVQGDFFKNTEIGKAAKGFEESLKTEVNLGGDPEKGEISHNVNVQIQAFEQKAWLHYRGLTDLQLTYRADRNNLDMRVQEHLGGSANLVITHNLQEQFSQASISWNW